jgi:hypothetical protein
LWWMVIVVVVFVVTIIVITTTFMQGIYSYIPETTLVFRVLLLELFSIYNLCYM